MQPIQTSIRVVACALFLVLLVPTIYAGDIQVSDSCTLADAIRAANSDIAVGGCPAGDGADVITLSTDVTLDAALPTVISTITISGEANAIRGNSRTHIIGLNRSGNLTINNVTISNGRSGWGGAIGNLGGTLTINSSTIKDNFADDGGAIGNEGTLTIRNSTISFNKTDGFGGAILNLGGKVSIVASTISHNAADGGSSGGAIFNDNGTVVIEQGSEFLYNTAQYKGGAIFNDEGTLKISESRFESNKVSEGRSGWGGAIYNSIISDDKEDDVTIIASTFRNNSTIGDGGAIYNYSGGNQTITNSTFFRNSANANGGALYDDSNDPTVIRNSTFFGNSTGADGHGGAIYIARGFGGSTKVSLYNSIIAGSIRGGDCYGKLNAQSNNLIEDASCFPDLSGDPMLGDLVEPENGSPSYFPLLEGSPAIDAAHEEYCPETDIIGTSRPQGDACDIGTYEFPSE